MIPNLAWVRRGKDLSNYPSIQKISADAAYRGTFVDEMKEKFHIEVDIVKRSDSGSWRILPKRWIVERTFAWMNNYRRMSKDYEINISSSESMIKIANSYTLLKRL